MTSLAVDWLPLRALEDSRIHSAAAKAVTTWSERWFGDNATSISNPNVRGGHKSPKIDEHAWRKFGPGIFVRWDENLAILLAKIVLDAPDDAVAYRENDVTLLARFSEMVLDNFCECLSSELSLGRSAVASSQEEVMSGYGVVEYTLDRGPNTPLFAIAIPAHCLVAFRKARIASEIDLTLPTATIFDATQSEKVEFTALLGAAKITGQEFCALDVGDVVVLDTQVDGPVSFISKKSGSIVGKAKVANDQGRLHLIAVADGV